MPSPSPAKLTMSNSSQRLTCIPGRNQRNCISPRLSDSRRQEAATPRRSAPRYDVATRGQWTIAFMIARLSRAGAALRALIAGDDRLAAVMLLLLLQARGKLLFQSQRLE